MPMFIMSLDNTKLENETKQSKLVISTDMFLAIALGIDATFEFAE